MNMKVIKPKSVEDAQKLADQKTREGNIVVFERKSISEVHLKIYNLKGERK